MHQGSDDINKDSTKLLEMRQLSQPETKCKNLKNRRDKYET
jgi:hypothetical protein